MYNSCLISFGYLSEHFDTCVKSYQTKRNTSHEKEMNDMNASMQRWIIKTTNENSTDSTDDIHQFSDRELNLDE